jgi:hypothetical protein
VDLEPEHDSLFNGTDSRIPIRICTKTSRIRNNNVTPWLYSPSLMQVKRLSRQLIAPAAPSTQEVVDDGGVLLARGEGGGVHHWWRGAHHHRVVRHVVHLGVDVLLFVTRSKIGQNS